MIPVMQTDMTFATGNCGEACIARITMKAIPKICATCECFQPPEEVNHAHCVDKKYYSPRDVLPEDGNIVGCRNWRAKGLKMNKKKQTFAIYDLDGRWLDHIYSEDISKAYKKAKCNFGKDIILMISAPSELLQIATDKTCIDLRDIFGGDRNYKINQNGGYVTFSIKTKTYEVCIWGDRQDFLKFLYALKDLQQVIFDMEKGEKAWEVFMKGFYWHGKDLNPITR